MDAKIIVVMTPFLVRHSTWSEVLHGWASLSVRVCSCACKCMLQYTPQLSRHAVDRYKLVQLRHTHSCCDNL